MNPKCLDEVVQFTHAWVKSRVRRRALLNSALLSLFPYSGAALAFAGYTSPGSRALSDGNASGDYLLAGDNKVLLRSPSSELAYSHQKKFSREPSIVTGALISPAAIPEQISKTQAIVCVETKLVALTITPNGTNKITATDLQFALNLTGPRDLRCAVDRSSGRWLAVNIRQGRALTSNGKNVSLESFGSAWTHAVSLDGHFVVFGENGLAVLIPKPTDDSSESEVIPLKAPWPDLENRDTLASRNSVLLRTGDTQTSLTYLKVDDNEANWSEPKRIPVSPCSEMGGCGAQLSEDGRWIIAGSWGTYVGRGTLFSRLNAPILSSDATSPGAAITGAPERYVLVGDIDSDVADLPSEANLARFIDAERIRNANFSIASTAPYRHVVWKKAETLSASEPHAEPLFAVKLHSNSVKSTGHVIIHSGALPETWPRSWIAVEPQVDFRPLALSSVWSPAPQTSAVNRPQPAWWSLKMGFARAMELLEKNSKSFSPVTVAVIDSGIDASHPALSSILKRNPGEVPNNGLDDDDNGLIDDDVGYDFVLEQPDLTDAFGHGTHVAGLISNVWAGKGPLGGAPNASLRIFRALDEAGKSNSIDLARALSAAIKDRADIINCSWGGGPETQILRDAFAAAAENHILIFTSAGNDGLKINDAQPVPKNYGGVVAIGAATERDSKARFSNWGDRIVFGFAPGVDITSTLPSAMFGEKSGTSMASPIASSTAAIVLGVLRSSHPEWSKQQQAEQALALLCDSANKKKLQKGFSKCGLLSTEGAVERLLENRSDLR